MHSPKPTFAPLKIAWLFLFLLLSAGAAEAARPTLKTINALPHPGSIAKVRFKPGEELRFRVHYGMLNAGRMVLKVDDRMYEHQGQECFRIIGKGRTISAFEWFYKVRDEFYTYVDRDQIRPLKYRRKSREGDYRFQDEVTFDYASRTISGTRGVFPMKPNTQDLLSAFYYARCLDLRNAPIGTVYQINTFLDDEIYPLGMKVKGKETIRTDVGTFRTIKIVPIVVDGRVFKGEEEMTIWVTDDENLMPLEVKSKLSVGSARATLTDFENLRYPLTSRVN